ncbi:MAG: hypothetical protein LBE22_04020 [Azoarcus sp.]|nr:hypothetical protein [Azoarcus sp.]
MTNEEPLSVRIKEKRTMRHPEAPLINPVRPDPFGKAQDGLVEGRVAHLQGLRQAQPERLWVVQIFPKLTTALLTCLFATPSFADAHDPALCDYYDLYAEFIVTFPKDTPLGRSGPSAVNGISFIFPDQSTLVIAPTSELYDPYDNDPDSPFSRRDDENFVRKYAKDGCNVTQKIKNEMDKRTKIVCENYEYTIIAADNQKSRRYIQLFYDFKSRKYDSFYQSIVDSLVLVPPNPQDEAKFYYSSMRATADYYYAQDAAFQESINSYQIPEIVCGHYRIRDKFVEDPSKK